MLMKLLPAELKRQIEVRVNLFYSFQKQYSHDIYCIAAILKRYGLNPVVSDGYYAYASTDLECNGTVNLFDAEKIVHELDNIPTHGFICYDPDGSFYLTE